MLCRALLLRYSAAISSLILPTVPGTRPIILGIRPVVACTRPVVAGTDPELTGITDLMQLN
jgi:hypothetical protein